jgi:dihydroneopterin aldolase
VDLNLQNNVTTKTPNMALARQAVWNAQVAQSACTDKIIVQNLAVTVNAGTDVWGRKKKQRALITVTVTLGNNFSSASSTDTVDESTVHYGTLSKAIQARIQDDSLTWMSTADLSISIAGIVRTAAGSAPIFAIETDVCYLKGSMFGDGAGHRTSIITQSGVYSNVLYLQNVRIPCLIGVNSNERLQKQPVVVNLWVDCVPASRVDDYAALETALAQVRPAQPAAVTLLTCPRLFPLLHMKPSRVYWPLLYKSSD